MTSKEYDYLFKLLMIGDSGVGKSCIIFRFAENNFLQSFIATIGIDFKIRTIEVDSKRIKLQVWDTAGQERFRTITTSYYRGAMGVFLVYDVTYVESYDNIRNWIGNVAQHANADVEKMLLANKSDLTNERVISREQGERLASEYRMHFAECSAKTGSGINEAFTLMAREIKAKLDRRNEAAAAAGGGGAGAASRNGNAGRSFFGRLRKRETGGGGGGARRKSKCSLL